MEIFGILLGMSEGEIFPTAVETGRKPEKKEKQWLPIKEVAQVTGYSEVRLRHIGREGRVPSKKVYREKGKRGFPWFRVMKIADVVRYRNSIDFSKIGKRPPGPDKLPRGWQKKRVDRKRVVFQGA